MSVWRRGGEENHYPRLQPKINVALFAKENGKLNSSAVGGVDIPPFGKPARNPVGGKQKVWGAKNVQAGVSFVDILTNKSHAVGEEDVIAIDPSVFSLSELFGRSFIGRSKGFKELRSLKTFLSSAGLVDAKIQYLGGLSVLISFSNGDSAKRFFDDKEVWANWFSSLNPWLGQSLPYEHLAWVSVLGVPPHLLSKEVFNDIGSRYGKVVFSSQFSVSDGDLSFDRMGILIGSGNRINGSLSLRWQDKKYQVWVIEENNHWLPDFLDVEELSEGFSPELRGNQEIPVFVSPTNLGNDALESEKVVKVPNKDCSKSGSKEDLHEEGSLHGEGEGTLLGLGIDKVEGDFNLGESSKGTTDDSGSKGNNVVGGDVFCPRLPWVGPM
ncbi:hypothetical protein Hanom_Chr10g00966121 [Helianthus anomalus]